MSTSRAWQLETAAAERYDAVLVPSILGPAAQALVRWTSPAVGDTVLDLGCGTGAAARHAAAAAGPSGRVVAVDVQPAMLEVGARGSDAGAPIDWMQAPADRLPLPDGSVDLVLCAQVLQFLSDREAALAEVRRVLRPGGRLALSLWAPLPQSPYFDALVHSIGAHIGQEVAGGLAAAFALVDADAVRPLLHHNGFVAVETASPTLELRLPGAARFVSTHVAATPMAAGFAAAPASARTAVVADVAERMQAFARDGDWVVPFTVLCVRGARPTR
ncbi:MAG: class I SAM-dependent methyltransferase [Gemmatimonadota bacterium]